MFLSKAERCLQNPAAVYRDDGNNLPKQNQKGNTEEIKRGG
jgi:hypothetical protein